ncbi:hypothetical protein AAFC00_006793 [Neodothiora populina]|uniref:Phosphatidate cytidylyltransferase n=1 Tax=Neodothiora populina TaxID=2781224 RepID=A0ABR3PB74_9PEZI
MSQPYIVPDTPRVISPSPTPSEQLTRDYFATKRTRFPSQEPINEENIVAEDPELARARTRSRSPQLTKKISQTMNGTAKPARRKPEPITLKDPDQDTNGHLSPASAVMGRGREYWRQLSRSPSPLGLIPIHREWRTFIHKHEIPRKFLHVSIGFVTIYLYLNGTQTSAIHPVLLSALIPIATTDFLRMRWPALNSLYIEILGPFMRESEAHDKYNGVISYLAGAWAVMRFCQKDVAVLSILLLSWCDTAASTFGRMWGKYTPRIRQGKSLAGTLAAFIVGLIAAVAFWQYIAPLAPAEWNTGVDSFAFDGALTLPPQLRQLLGWSKKDSTIDGYAALAVVAVTSGVVASGSEAIDVMGLDDNLTIPILCGIALGAFFWTFGNHV